MTSLILSLLLTLAPPADAPAQGYADALTQLEKTSLAAANSVDPEVLATLATALAGMDGYIVELADDPDGRQDVVMARLNLARGYLKAGDTAAAEREIDQVVREAFGDKVPASRFGPEVNKLYKSRQAALEAAGKATLDIVCHEDCAIVIGTRRVEPGTQELLLGTYGLRISSPTGSVELLERSVELSEAGGTIVVEFAAPPEPEPEPEPAIEPEPEPENVPAPVVDEPPPVVPPPAPKRIAPRGIEIDGMVLGAGLAIAGGVMLAYDGRCTDGSKDLTSCPKVFEGTVGGAVSIGLGGALLITTTVLLAIDESRLARESSSKTARFERGVLRF